MFITRGEKAGISNEGTSHSDGSLINHIFSEEERKTKVCDATIETLWKIHNSDDAASLKVMRFFSGHTYRSNSKSFGMYFHRLMQFSFKAFFEGHGYKVKETYYVSHDNSMSGIRQESFEISQTEKYKGYSDGYVLMENEKTNHKIAIQLDNDRYDHSVWYNVMQTEEDIDFLDKWLEYSRKNNFYRGKKIDGSCNFLKLNKDFTWKDVVIPDKIRKVIKSSVDGLFDVREILTKNGFSIKRGTILAGAPGCGKTCIAKILAAEMNISVLYVLPSHLKNIGDISRICDMAQDISPTLLILEDIDYIAKDRDLDQGWSVVELMNKVDGLEEFTNVITLATTNLIEKVEQAIKNRPGRFDKVIFIDKPDAKCRKEMFSLFTKNVIVGEDVDVDDIVKKTDKMSGAYISYLVQAAAVEATFEQSYDENSKIIVKAKHFKTALQEIKDKDVSAIAEELSSKRMGFGPQNED